jgi:release factor family 10
MEADESRDYDAYVGYPGRSPDGRHVAEFDQRIREWRQRFLRATAQAVAAQVTDLGWHRILLVGQPRVTGPFLQQLPRPARPDGWPDATARASPSAAGTAPC